MFEYKCFIKRVIDGDTFEGVVDLGFKLTTTQKFRVADIDTPETYRPKSEEERDHGKQATARAKELLEGKTLIVKTSKSGKYGRWLAHIVLEDGLDYAETMINEGFQKRDDYT